MPSPRGRDVRTHSAGTSGRIAIEELLQDLAQRLLEQPEIVKVLLLALTTLLSEDLTCVAAGMLIGSGELDWWTGLIGCYVGIVIGDGLLWLLGHSLGRRALKLPIVRQMAPPEKLARAERWFSENGLKVVLISRCLPGSRFATYLCAGILGARARNFILLATIAASIWTPLVVWAAARFQDSIAPVFTAIEAHPVLTIILSLVILLGSLRLVGLLSSQRERQLWRARWARRLHTEFLPVWLFELPIGIYALWLAVRFRGLRLPLLVNPSIPLGGFVGESKTDILAMLDNDDGTIAPAIALPASQPLDEKCAHAEAWLAQQNFGFPVIVKPDLGQRGVGVQRVADSAEMRAAIEATHGDVVIQEYISEPFEAGVSFLCAPGESEGRISSITLKEFPTVVGDGVSTLEELVLRHPRQRLWAEVFMHRLGERVVETPAAGEVVSLGLAGNHAQGTTFRNASERVTPELAAWTNEMAARIEGGLHVGRFDVRAASEDDFFAARGLRVIELNGVTGEPTHIYDPDHGLLRAWRDLGSQWKAAFRFGRSMRDRGAPVPSYGEFFRAAWHNHKQSKGQPAAH